MLDSSMGLGSLQSKATVCLRYVIAAKEEVNINESRHRREGHRSCNAQILDVSLHGTGLQSRSVIVVVRIVMQLCGYREPFQVVKAVGLIDALIAAFKKLLP